MSKRSILRRIWDFLGHASLVQWIIGLALAGLTAPRAFVADFLAGMPFGPRLIFVTSVGLLVLGIALAVMQWLVLHHFKPPWLIGAPEADTSLLTGGSQEKLAAAEAQVADLQAESEQLRAENKSLRGELNEAQAGFSNRNAGMIALYQESRFGEKLPEFYPLDPERLRLVISRMHELTPDLQGMIAGAREVWAHLSTLAASSSSPSPVPLRDRVEGFERGNFERVAQSFLACLDHDHDPRPVLARTYTCYRQWRTWIARFAGMLGHPVAATPGYIIWMDAERRFFDELRKKLALPELEPVRKAVDTYDKENGSREDLSQA